MGAALFQGLEAAVPMRPPCSIYLDTLGDFLPFSSCPSLPTANNASTRCHLFVQLIRGKNADL